MNVHKEICRAELSCRKSTWVFFLCKKFIHDNLSFINHFIWYHIFVSWSFLALNKYLSLNMVFILIIWKLSTSQILYLFFNVCVNLISMNNILVRKKIPPSALNCNSEVFLLYKFCKCFHLVDCRPYHIWICPCVMHMSKTKQIFSCYWGR